MAKAYKMLHSALPKTTTKTKSTPMRTTHSIISATATAACHFYSYYHYRWFMKAGHKPRAFDLDEYSQNAATAASE